MDSSECASHGPSSWETEYPSPLHVRGASHGVCTILIRVMLNDPLSPPWAFPAIEKHLRTHLRRGLEPMSVVLFVCTKWMHLSAQSALVRRHGCSVNITTLHQLLKASFWILITITTCLSTQLPYFGLQRHAGGDHAFSGCFYVSQSRSQLCCSRRRGWRTKSRSKLSAAHRVCSRLFQT